MVNTAQRNAFVARALPPFIHSKALISLSDLILAG
jgi:hypothetical protein